MANWPEKTDCCTGTCVKFGAPDLRRYGRLFNNQNVNNACYSCSTVCIQECNEVEFQAGACGVSALYFQSCGNCFKYRIATSALAADRVITLPVATGADSFVFNCATATLTSKTVDLASCNTILDTCASTGDVLQYNATCCAYQSQALRETFFIRFGNNCTAVATGNGQYEFQMPYCFTLTDVYATVATASSCGVPSIQIQQNALDILSTAITIDATEKTSRTAAVAAVISDNTLDINGVITFDVDVAGTSTAGLVIGLIGYQRF